MKHYSYGGLELNPLENDVYYCYLIFDKNFRKFYSGSRGATGRKEHDLFDKYFTKSTVIDFTDRLKRYPEEFEYKIEYFRSRKEAFLAEAEFHRKHNVAKSTEFYNARNHGVNEDCGAGTILCKDEQENVYRISCEEYKTGKHKFVCSDRMIVRYKSDPSKISSILKKDFDPDVHLTQFQGHVLCYDKLIKKNVRIPTDEFYQNKEIRYVGITKGKITAFDLVNNEKCSVGSEEFYSNPERYVGVSKGNFPVINRETGKIEIIRKQDYDKTKHRHFNDGKTVQFSLREKKNVSISVDEYQSNKHLYMNLAARYLYLVDDTIYHRLEDLKKYVRKKYNISIPRIKIEDLGKKFSLIKVITKDDFINGKY